MFAIYQAVPQFTRALEHVDHFSWPFVGPLITAAGQIPVDPEDRRTTVAGLKKAAEMLEQGESITVLPEGSRTLDGSVGLFFKGAFRLAIRAKVPVVPLAIRGGRSVSRRGDWRIRPGKEEVLIGTPILTKDLKLCDAEALAEKCRQAIIELLQGRVQPEE
jgi:putative phosphoserine phosphatase/1-acylglycerol-3-phosphate O-acyltransferase